MKKKLSCNYLGKFKNEVNAIVVFVDFLKMDDVRMLEGRHHLDFSVDQPTQIFVFDGFRVFGNSGVDTGSRSVRSFLPDEARLVDDFDGHEAPRNEQRLGQIDPGKCAFSEQLAELVKLFGRDAFDQPRWPTLPVSGSRRQRAGEARATAPTAKLC